jgi:hypothetical protein
MTTDAIHCPHCGSIDLTVVYQATVVQGINAARWNADGSVVITDYDTAHIDFDAGLTDSRIECALCLTDAFMADPQDDDRFIPLDAQGARQQRMKRELHITGGH